MFWENYLSLCARSGKSANAVAKELSIASGTVSEWKKGRVPQNATLRKIADYFGISVEKLLGNVSEDDELNEYLEELRTRPELKMLFSLAKNATKQDIEQAVAIIEALRKSGNE